MAVKHILDDLFLHQGGYLMIQPLVIKHVFLKIPLSVRKISISRTDGNIFFRRLIMVQKIFQG